MTCAQGSAAAIEAGIGLPWALDFTEKTGVRGARGPASLYIKIRVGPRINPYQEQERAPRP